MIPVIELHYNLISYPDRPPMAEAHVTAIEKENLAAEGWTNVRITGETSHKPGYINLFSSSRGSIVCVDNDKRE